MSDMVLALGGSGTQKGFAVGGRLDAVVVVGVGTEGGRRAFVISLKGEGGRDWGLAMGLPFSEGG